MARKKEKIVIELSERDKIKRGRRARGGRTLPRSGAGVHEDKKSKKIEYQLEEEYDNEIREYIAGYGRDYDLEDNLTKEEQDEWNYWNEYLKELENASTD